jgi:methionyl-tRNA synthetase
MATQLWWIGAGALILSLVGGVWLLRRMPVFQWYCGRCKKVVAASRRHPGKCACGTDRLTAYFCQTCSSWNTSPTSKWHCNDCSSPKVRVGVEYHLIQARWRWRNQAA